MLGLAVPGMLPSVVPLDMPVDGALVEPLLEPESPRPALVVPALEAPDWSVPFGRPQPVTIKALARAAAVSMNFEMCREDDIGERDMEFSFEIKRHCLGPRGKTAKLHFRHGVTLSE